MTTTHTLKGYATLAEAQAWIDDFKNRRTDLVLGYGWSATIHPETDGTFTVRTFRGSSCD